MNYRFTGEHMEPTPPATFGALVEQRMTDLDLTATDIVQRLGEIGAGVTRQSLWLWRRDKRTPSTGQLVALLDVLQVHGVARADALNKLGRPDAAATT